MTAQLSLISDTPIARRADPVTSHRAADQITASGERARQQNLVLGGLKVCPGMTSAELAAYLHTDRFLTARRLPELRASGLAENGEARPCGITGKSCLTWYLRGRAPRSAA